MRTFDMLKLQCVVLFKEFRFAKLADLLPFFTPLQNGIFNNFGN